MANVPVGVQLLPALIKNVGQESFQRLHTYKTRSNVFQSVFCRIHKNTGCNNVRASKVKSKWIKELHIKPEAVKLIEEKVRKNLEDIW